MRKHVLKLDAHLFFAGVFLNTYVATVKMNAAGARMNAAVEVR